MEDSLQNRIPTKGSQLQKDHQFQAVVFNSNKKTANKSITSKKYESQASGLEFDIKTATKEIIKLGAKGFYQRRRDRTMKSLVVELGAKPEKSRYHNYKELKEIKKKNRERKERHLNMLKESNNLSAVNQYKRKAVKKQQKRNKSETSILNKYGKRR